MSFYNSTGKIDFSINESGKIIWEHTILHIPPCLLDRCLSLKTEEGNPQMECLSHFVSQRRGMRVAHYNLKYLLLPGNLVPSIGFLISLVKEFRNVLRMKLEENVIMA